MSMTRKQFLRSLASLAGSTFAVTAIQGCGGGGDGAPMPSPAPTPPSPSPSPPAPAPGPQSCGATDISGNHGHTLTIPTADLDSMDPKTYDIRGTADHSHTVTLSATQLALLKTTGATVNVVSSSAQLHTHDVTVGCM